MVAAAGGERLGGSGGGTGPGGAARLAYHFDQCDDQERAHRYALQAANEAGALSATDAERAHRELAAAHSPQALPPVTPSKRSLRRMWPWPGSIMLVAASAVGIIGVLGGLSLRPALSALSANLGLRQGTLYLAPSGEIGASHSVRWGWPIGRPRVVRLVRPPTTLPPQVLALN